MLCAVTTTLDDAPFVPAYLDHLRPHVDAFVVLDLGSRDATRDLLRREPSLALIEGSPGAGVDVLFERAHQLGAHNVLWIDPDERLDAEFLSGIRSHIAAGQRDGRTVLGVWARTLDDTGESFYVHGTFGLDHKYVVFPPELARSPEKVPPAQRRLVDAAAYRPLSAAGVSHRRLGVYSAFRPDPRVIDLQARPPRLRAIGASDLPVKRVEQTFAACECEDWSRLGDVAKLELTHDLGLAASDVPAGLAAWWRRLARSRSFATNEALGDGEAALVVYKGERWLADLRGWCRIDDRKVSLRSLPLSRPHWQRVFASSHRISATSADLTPAMLLSIVIPYYKRLADFERVLPLNAPTFEHSGVEVLLCLDEPSEEPGVLALLRRYPNIRWTVIVNDADHAWRTPCRAINVGIRHAVGRYVLVVSPESALICDVTNVASRLLASGSGVGAIGWVGFATFDDLQRYGTPAACHAAVASGEIPSPVGERSRIPYGSICVERERLVAIGGYDEDLDLWGGDDDNVRLRLEQAGATIAICEELQVLHLGRTPRTPPWVRRGLLQLLPIYEPQDVVANPQGWGRTFDRIAFTWRDPR